MSQSLTERDRARRVVAADLEIENLGPCLYPSPLAERLLQSTMHHVGRADRVLLDDHRSEVLAVRETLADAPSFELAGPRDRLFFDPATLRAGVVTCGGLCPGLNNVIRGLVVEFYHGYGIQHIYGFRYGYEGLVKRSNIEPIRLTPDVVAGAQHDGGTLLGSSRGNQDPGEMVDRLVELGISALFVIGGDGTFRGAMGLVAEIRRRNLSIVVIGIPKTIDNDIHFIDRSFGFETAFSAAVEVIRSAHSEAMGARNGISIVKLMGRHSGFIACHAALASTDVDVVLVPESSFTLGGKGGLFEFLEARLAAQSHAVIVVAEGAGQELFTENDAPPATDPSGNVRLLDIGLELKERIARHFNERRLPILLRYLDPSYHIRSVPASPADSVYCWQLARNAVHAAMAGNTNMLIGRWHGRFVHVPMSLATRYRRQVNTSGDLWAAVVESTGQPHSFGPAPGVGASMISPGR
jgi:6-phosphofructokinase 1